MLVRTLTALVTIPIYLLALYYGGWIWTVFVCLLAAIATVEMLRVAGKVFENRFHFHFFLALSIGLLLIITAYLFPESIYKSMGLAFICTFLLCSVVELGQVSPTLYQKCGWVFFTTVYIGFFFSHLVLLRNLPSGWALALYVTLVIWATDSFAYFVGIKFGKHKLLPKISPKKSVEGALGGLAASMITGALIGHFTELGILKGFLGGFILSLTGQVGDLVASSIKREFSVKDSGTLLPGHGGIIDRFDSLLVSGMVLYYLHLLIGGDI
jgi:phosphatidate cytidylyltransferase